MNGLTKRRYGERRRDALEALGEGMKDWIAGANIVPLDADRRFTRHLVHWPICSQCGAPLAAFPHSFGVGVAPVFFCTLCDLRYLDEHLRQIDRRVADLDPVLDSRGVQA